MMARSFARLLNQNGTKMAPARTLQGLQWTDAERKAMNAAAIEYRRLYGGRMQYNPDGMTNQLDSIIAAMNAAAKAAKEAGEPAPIVVVDYLQIIEGKEKQDMQEAIKASVMALKKFAI